jgi:hypothetical protein
MKKGAERLRSAAEGSIGGGDVGWGQASNASGRRGGSSPTCVTLYRVLRGHAWRGDPWLTGTWRPGGGEALTSVHGLVHVALRLSVAH